MKSIAWILVIVALVAFGLVRVLRARSAGITAHQWVGEGARLVDVRTPEEFAGRHLDGAINIPIDEFAGRTKEIGHPSAAVVVYCRSGARSAAAARLLASAGFSKVLDLGPMAAW